MSGVESSAQTAFGRPGRAREYESGSIPLLKVYPDLETFWWSALDFAICRHPVVSFCRDVE